MSNLIPYMGYLIPPGEDQNPYKAQALSVEGSGLTYKGAVLFILAQKLLYICSPKDIEAQIFYDSIADIEETDFKGLVIERQSHGKSVRTAPTETAAVEIRYNRDQSGYTRRIKLLVFHANNARDIVETTRRFIEGFKDSTPPTFSGPF